VAVNPLYFALTGGGPDVKDSAGVPWQGTFVNANGDHLFFNPEAFGPGPLGGFGNANRQFFHGPGIDNFDISLMKTTKITESKAFEIRAEFFNVFNHTQFNNPDGDLNGNMGVVSSARDPRIGQFSAKFVF